MMSASDVRDTKGSYKVTRRESPDCDVNYPDDQSQNVIEKKRRSVPLQRMRDAKAVIRLLRHNRLVSLYGPRSVGTTAFLQDTLLEQLWGTSHSRHGYEFFPVYISLSNVRYKARNHGFRLADSIHESVKKTWNRMYIVNERDNSAVLKHSSLPTTDPQQNITALEYLQSSTCGFTAWKNSVGLVKSVEPVLIFDDIEEIFRDAPGNDHAGKIESRLVEEQWLNIFHELTDLSEQRLLMGSGHRDNARPGTSENAHLGFRTLLCFDESSIGMIRRLKLALPSAMRATYRLTGFTPESAIRMLVDASSTGGSSRSFQYARAANVIDLLTASNLDDTRQLALDKLINASSNRLLGERSTSRPAEQHTITGSQISLARVMLRWQARQLDSQSGIHSGISAAASSALYRIRVAFVKKRVVRKLLFQFNRMRQWLSQSSPISDKTNHWTADARILSEFTPGIESSIRRKNIGAAVKLFSNSRNNPQPVLLDDVKRVLNRKHLWFLLPNRFRLQSADEKFESWLRHNPLFQFNDSAEGTVVELTNPLVLRSLQLSHGKTLRKKKIVLVVVLAALVGYFAYSAAAIQAGIKAANEELEFFNERRWSDIVTLNDVLLYTSNIKDDSSAQQRWLDIRQQDVEIWLARIEKKYPAPSPELTRTEEVLGPEGHSLVAAQLQLYLSNTPAEAIDRYQPLSTTIKTLYLPVNSRTDPVCSTYCSFVNKTWMDTFQYLLLSLSTTDKEFRGANSGLTTAQLNVVGTAIREICEYTGESTFALRMPAIPESLVLTLEQCKALYKGPRV